MESGKIARNTIYLTVATVGQKVLAFLYFILIARLAGVEGTGKYFFVVSFTTIFSIFVDLGLSSVLIRETAKKREMAGKYLGNILGAKVVLGVLAYFAVVGIINVMGYPAETKLMVYLSGLVMLLDSFNVTFYAVFRGHQNLRYESMGVVISEVLIIVFGGVSLILHAPLYFLLLALMSGSLFNFFFSSILLWKKTEVRPCLCFDKTLLISLFKIAYPFALAGIFVKVYSYLDAVLLSKMVGDAAVGFWSVAYKLTYAFQFIPMAFSAAAFPAMSAYFISDKTMLRKTFERVLFYLAIIAMPVAFGIFSLAEPLILKLYGVSYAASILPLQVAIFAVVFIFLNYPIGSLLNATDRQMTNTIIMGVCMALNVVLNVILIPRFSYLGAAISTVISHTLLFTIGLIFAGRVVAYNKKFIFIALFKIVISAGAMSAVIIYLRPYVYWVFLIPIGAIIYFVLLFLLRGMEFRDVTNIFKALKREEVAEMIEGKEEV
ncbi:flippase [Patescibacteria group bacterium]|nr:flippase [Patescibacteria group bacterium]